jgi:phytoene synthase
VPRRFRRLARHIDTVPVSPNSPWGDQVHRLDRDRFVCSLFAPEREREGLFALYAFNAEVAQVRELVREPLLGEIRLQWWRDSIDAIYVGKAAATPVVLALDETIRRFRLPRAPFDRLLQGRARDWREAAPACLHELVDYADATSGELAVLAAQIVAPDDAAAPGMARNVGIAWALTGLLRAIPHHAAMRRAYLPADLSRAADLDVERLFETAHAPQLARVVERLAAEASRYLSVAR